MLVHVERISSFVLFLRQMARALKQKQNTPDVFLDKNRFCNV